MHVMSGVFYEDQWPLVNISLQLKWHRQKTVNQKPHPRPPCWLWHVECYVLRLMNLLPRISHYSQCHLSHLKQRGAVLVGCVLSPSNHTATCSCLPGGLAPIQIAEVKPLLGKHRSAFLNCLYVCHSSVWRLLCMKVHWYTKRIQCIDVFLHLT
jgi:hypothetical protein